MRYPPPTTNGFPDEVWLRILRFLSVEDIISFSLVSLRCAQLAKICRKSIYNLRLHVQGTGKRNYISLHSYSITPEIVYEIEDFARFSCFLIRPERTRYLRSTHCSYLRPLIVRALCSTIHLCSVIDFKLIEISVSGEVGHLSESWLDTFRAFAVKVDEMTIKKTGDLLADKLSRIFKSRSYTFLRCKGQGIRRNDHVCTASNLFFSLSKYSISILTELKRGQHMWAINSGTYVPDTMVTKMIKRWYDGDRLVPFFCIRVCCRNTWNLKRCMATIGASRVIQLRNQEDHLYHLTNKNGALAALNFRVLLLKDSDSRKRLSSASQNALRSTVLELHFIEAFPPTPIAYPAPMANPGVLIG